jgi:NAD+ kinase
VNELEKLQNAIANAFDSAFGKTSLEDRVADLLAQAASVGRYRDPLHLRQEAGDILCSLLQMCTECGWIPSELVSATLKKIESRTAIYQTLGRKLRVGILSGAFDPVHVSHLDFAQTVLDAGCVDEVWLTPSFEHLGGKRMAPADLRLEMCRIACQNKQGISVFDYEVRHEFRGEPYHLIKKLLADESAQLRTEYYFLLGQHDAETLESWSCNAESLERLIPFVVVANRGSESPQPDAWYLNAPHRFLPSANEEPETNSNEVRGMLDRGDEVAPGMLPVGVLDFIRKHSLYQPTPRPKNNRKIAVYASTFDPPSLYQRHEAQALIDSGFDEVIIYPTGPRPQRHEFEHARPLHRAAIVSLAFRDMPQVVVDDTDLTHGIFSSACDLESRFANEGEVWHVVHQSMMLGGDHVESVVQTKWDEGDRLWKESRFVILQDDSESPESQPTCLPAQSRIVKVAVRPSSEDLRSRVYHGDSIADSVDPDVDDYIQRHKLFLPNSRERQAVFRLQTPRIQLVFDERNAKSVAMAQQYLAYQADHPNLVLVLGGDGTMLRAIREHWQLRVPFVGLNTGHLGFLMNERLPTSLDGLELVSYSLPMLRVDAKRPNGEQFSGLAFTDVWLERAEGQAAWIRVDVDGETRVSKVIGDGMLIATASGSSAYARAMGAVPVPIDTPTLTLAGSNVFQPRFWKPMVLNDESLITLASLDYSGKRPLRGFIDGMPLGIVQEIMVRQSLTASVELAFTKEFDPSARLLRSFFPPGSTTD